MKILFVALWNMFSVSQWYIWVCSCMGVHTYSHALVDPRTSSGSTDSYSQLLGILTDDGSHLSCINFGALLPPTANGDTFLGILPFHRKQLHPVISWCSVRKATSPWTILMSYSSSRVPRGIRWDLCCNFIIAQLFLPPNIAFSLPFGYCFWAYLPTTTTTKIVLHANLSQRLFWEST